MRAPTPEASGEPEGISGVLGRAAQQFGTPVYVLDARTIANAAAQVERAFPAPWVWQYSVKANDLPAVIGLLGDRGWGASVVSAGEWTAAATAPVPTGAISFEGIGKTDAELEHAVAVVAGGQPLRWLVIESAVEAHVLAGLAERAGLGRGGRPLLDVLLRVNPQVDPETSAQFAVGAAASKFGMSKAEALSVVRNGLGGTGIRVRGVHVHVGSDLRGVAAWAGAGVHAVRALTEMKRYATTADTVDFGGGFALPNESAPPPAQFYRALVDLLASHGLRLPPRPAIEPGRYLVGAAGWLVSSVLHARVRPEPSRQVVLDAGMTELIRPALYGSHHPIYALELPPRGTPGRHHSELGEYDVQPTAVEGPVCESTDTFGTHPLPPLHRGDLVALSNAGAYAASFTSRYNGRPQPAEVLLMADGSLKQCARPEHHHQHATAATAMPARQPSGADRHTLQNEGS